jgi:hypothetical protein
MPRPVKVLIWVVVFGACAAAGAYVAAHTDPFPPGVDDPGARTPEPSIGATPSDPPAASQAARWVVRLESTSSHTVRVGGACRTEWGGRITLRLEPAGDVSGSGTAAVSRSGCDFPVAQEQAQTVELTFAGARDAGEEPRITASIGRLEPTGSRDLGGFVETIRGATFRFEGGVARVVAERPDGAEGTFRSETTLTCVGGCDG